MPSDIAAAAVAGTHQPSADQLAAQLTAVRAQLHAVRLIIEGGPPPPVRVESIDDPDANLRTEARTQLHAVRLIVEGGTPPPVRTDDQDTLAAELRQAEGTLECLRIIAER